MKTITIEEIRKLQEGYNVTPTQQSIETGDIWKFEGSAGRFAMSCLEAGICFLGEKLTRDYYGNTIPPRGVLEDGSKGSLNNAQNFWQRVWEGDDECIESLEASFGADVEDEVV